MKYIYIYIYIFPTTIIYRKDSPLQRYRDTRTRIKDLCSIRQDFVIPDYEVP